VVRVATRGEGPTSAVSSGMGARPKATRSPRWASSPAPVALVARLPPSSPGDVNLIGLPKTYRRAARSQACPRDLV